MFAGTERRNGNHGGHGRSVIAFGLQINVPRSMGRAALISAIRQAWYHYDKYIVLSKSFVSEMSTFSYLSFSSYPSIVCLKVHHENPKFG